MLDFKQELKKAVIGLGLALVLWGVIAFGSLSMWQIMALLCLVSIGVNIYQGRYSLPRLITNCLIVIALVLFFTLLSQFGWIGYVGSIGTITAVILWQKWKPYLEAKQHIESLIWGKPLKEFIANKERPPSVKIIR